MKTKNILIVGGSGRIGNMLVLNFLKQGHNVLSLDIKNKLNFKDKKKIDPFLKNYFFYKCDIKKLNLLNKILNKIFAKYKKIDVVINASYPTTKNWPTKFNDIEPTELKENLYNQLGTAIILAKLFYKIFLKQKFGNLILFSSIQGILSPKFDHYKNTKMTSPIEYSAIKSGIISITKYLAKFSKGKNIKVNCIIPGGILDSQPKVFLKRYKKDCLSKGMLDSQDIFGAVNFLVSDDSKFINGQAIVIDDGWSL